jgi:hypothetical protein
MMISDQDAALLKGAIQRARTAAGAAPGAPPGAIWNYINRPDPISARDFINAAPPQGAGEAAFSNRPDGTVDVYYFL